MNPISQITDFLPRYVCLFYVDYRDSLMNMKIFRRNVSGPTAWKVCMKRVSNGMKARNRRIWRYMDETRRNMEKAGLSGLFKEHEEQIRDLIYERNDSNPAKDLIRNSCDTNLFYSLGVEIDGYSTGCPERGESVSMACYKVRRALRLPKGKFDGPVKNSLKTLHTAENYGFTSMPGLTDSSVPERRRISNVSASAEMWWWPSLTAATVQVITYTFLGHHPAVLPGESVCGFAGTLFRMRVQNLRHEPTVVQATRWETDMRPFNGSIRKPDDRIPTAGRGL